MHRTGDPCVQLEGLVPGYATKRRRTAVSAPIDHTLSAGEFACLIGPNGAGKSTLMRTMAGLQAPLDGVVRFKGGDVHRLSPSVRARHLAVVLTEAVHVPMLSAYDLTAFGRVPFTDWNGRLTDDDHRIVAQALDAVGATALAARFVVELSDGEGRLEDVVQTLCARRQSQGPRVHPV
jgi:iron complex transport system ATP-binding protein